jgi:ATP-dependent DNA helicase DinG
MMTWDTVEQRLAESLSTYETRAPQQRLAHQIENALADVEHLSAQAGTGCIQGDAEIVVNRAGIGRRMTLRDLVVRFNGGRTEQIDSHGRRSVQPKAWDLSIPTYVQREVDGVVRLVLLQSAWFSGVKSTYTVTTETGRAIRATDEHPFLTERGWLRLDELQVGDAVHVRGGQATGQPREPKRHYRTRSGLVGHPYATRRLATRHAYRYWLHRLVAEAALNNLDLDTFLDRLRDGATTRDLQFIDPATHAVHHLDHDPLNNDLANLKVMTHSEHHALHAEEGKTDSVLYKVITEKVVSIELFGNEKTYDIEVADDPHNFIVNGFVVHNTGKSFALLIPAIEHAVNTGSPVIVSTATKALQDQYAKKDLPFLQEHTGLDFGFAVVKGRSNYLCRAKLNDLAPNTVVGQETLLEQAGEIGDLDQMDIELRPADRSKLVSTSDECPGRRECPFGEICFAEQAKARAKLADVVVVNHAMLVTDAVLRAMSDGFMSLLPNPGAVCVDEAHELEAYATSALGSEFGQGSITRLVAEVSNFAEEPRAGAALLGATSSLFSSLADLLGKSGSAPIGEDEILQHEDEFVSMIESMRDLFSVLEDVDTWGDDGARNRKKRLTKRVDSMINRLTSVMLAESTEMVRWIERDEKRGVLLKYAPLSVAPFLRENVWVDPVDGHTRPSVLLSATLALGSDFSYINNRLGIDDYVGFDAGTPFDYPKQAALFVPDGCDPTRGAEWYTQCHAITGELLRAADGRALLLFTSRMAMNEAHSALKGLIEGLGHRVLRQGDLPNQKLSEIFTQDEHSVLFALRSFMTGIDVQGDSLRLVVIDKLPFPVPTDVINKARCAAVDAVARNKWHDGSFPALTVPGMALVLMQAFGRLIRTQDDRGLVAILDSRLWTKRSYGPRIMAALPPARRVRQLREATQYLRELGG